MWRTRIAQDANLARRSRARSGGLARGRPRALRCATQGRCHRAAHSCEARSSDGRGRVHSQRQAHAGRAGRAQRGRQAAARSSRARPGADASRTTPGDPDGDSRGSASALRPRSRRALARQLLSLAARSRSGEDEAGASRADRRDACTAGLPAVRSCCDGRSPGHDGPPRHASRCMARRDGGERLSIRGSRDSASTLDARVSRPEGRDRLAGLPDRAGASRFPGLGRP